MAGDQGLKCSVNHAGCKGEAERLCHHCGRPLCSGYNCCRWGWDPALAGWPITYHCPACDDLPRIVKYLRNAINHTNQFYDVALVSLSRMGDKLGRKGT